MQGDPNFVAILAVLAADLLVTFAIVEDDVIACTSPGSLSTQTIVGHIDELLHGVVLEQAFVRRLALAIVAKAHPHGPEDPRKGRSVHLSLVCDSVLVITD